RCCGLRGVSCMPCLPTDSFHTRDECVWHYTVCQGCCVCYTHRQCIPLRVGDPPWKLGWMKLPRRSFVSPCGRARRRLRSINLSFAIRTQPSFTLATRPSLILCAPQSSACSIHAPCATLASRTLRPTSAVP